MADEKPANIAALDEKAYGAAARESRREALQKNAKGDHLGAAEAAAKGTIQAIGHQLAHPIDGTAASFELLSTPVDARKEYLQSEKNR
jgi:hypothetical protein